MAIGNLFGTGSESNSLYGTSLTSNGASSFIYFEWFIFKVSTGQPTTPTGGSWDFATNTGTPPTGWTSSINGVPLNNLWFSVAFVDSRNPTNITWSTAGLLASSTSIYATAYADTFTGNGSTTNWTLTQDPVVVNNLDVSINGVTQTPTVDYTISGTTFTTTTAAPLGSIILVKYRQALPNSYFGMANNVGYTPHNWIAATNVQAALDEVADDIAATDGISGSNLVGYKPAGSTSVATKVQAKLREIVSVKDFGAVCDGVTDDTAAVQAAVNYCASLAPYWPTLVVPGRCKLTASVNINRPVDTTKTEFRIVGQGAGAGFYASGTVTMFDSTIAMGTGSGTAPVSEFVTFDNINFEASSYFDEVFVISRKFLRMKFLNCFFWLTRCQVSDTYTQTIYFVACNIRNNKTNFINTAGLYDVTFDSCIIENGQTIIRSIDPSYGTSGLRFINNVIEGIGTSVVVATGVAGFDLIGNHIEANFSPEFNFFAGTLTNSTVSVIGNYIYNPSGVTFYYGPTTSVFSAGNTAFPSVLHSNAVQITNLVSNADYCSGGISDATNYSTVNGSYRAGSAVGTWTDSGNQITKDINGNFAIGNAPLSNTRLFVRGTDQTSSNSAGGFADSAGNTIMAFRNDRQIVAPALQNFANDTAAAAGGISVGSLYRNGSVVQVRVT